MATNLDSSTTPRSRRLVRVTAATLIGALVIAGAACSSDADEPATTESSTTATSAAGASGSATSEGTTGTTAAGDEGGASTTIDGPTNDVGTGEGSPEVTAYCDEVDQVAQLMADLQADPSNEAANEVNDRLAQLTQDATQLLEDHPDEVDRINDCAEALYGN